jgi:hypothetical protein
MLLRVILVAALIAGLAQTCPAESLTNLLGQLNSSTKASGDATLQSLGNELGTKATSLNASLAGNPAAQSQLTSGVQSLLSGNGASSLGALSKLTEAKLTPDQMKLAKEVGNVGSAYVVQKNFASLEGSQSDVAQIVTSLRKGNATAALPAVQKVAQNAKLTSPQKELLSSVADKYAPSAKKLGGALESGLKSIPGFGK